MKTIDDNLYDYPAYYDLIFGSDWSAELNFLRQCFSRYGQGTIQRLFEPACGTGRLLYRLGRLGYDVSGLDLNPAVAYCNARLRRNRLPASVFVGDMADFRLPRRVDAAFNMINSFRHLPTDKSAQSHLRCVAHSLRPGGLYLLGLHLTPTAGSPMDEECWSARRGNLCVNTQLRTTERDLRARRERCTMLLDIYTPTRSWRIRDELVFRTYTRRQFGALLAKVENLEVLNTFDFSYDIDCPAEVENDTEDVVWVLQKRGKSGKR